MVRHVLGYANTPPLVTHIIPDYAHPTTGVMEGETRKSGAVLRAVMQALTELGFKVRPA